MLFALFLCQRADGGNGQNDDAQHDTIQTEELEVMTLDVIHQEADGGQTDHESHDTARDEDADLRAGDGRARDGELDDLQQRSGVVLVLLMALFLLAMTGMAR